VEKINRAHMKAIIIDDEEQSHLVLTNLLTKNHMDIDLVGHAYNVEEGVTLIQQKQPELVFLDVEMPDGTGFDLLRQIIFSKSSCLLDWLFRPLKEYFTNK